MKPNKKSILGLGDELHKISIELNSMVHDFLKHKSIGLAIAVYEMMRIIGESNIQEIKKDTDEAGVIAIQNLVRKNTKPIRKNMEGDE